MTHAVHTAGLSSTGADTGRTVNMMDRKSRKTLLVLVPCGIPPKTSTIALTSDSISQPMPVHWTNDFPGVWPCVSFILKLTFTVLVIISFGRTSLHQQWKKIHSSEEEFTECIDRIVARTSTITVVVRRNITKMDRTLTSAISRPVCSSRV